MYKREGVLTTKKDFVMFEEVFHCVQFINGEWGFAVAKDGNWAGTLGLDFMDEVNVKNQAARALNMTDDFTIKNISDNYPMLNNISIGTTAEKHYSSKYPINYGHGGRYSSERFLFYKPTTQIKE